MQEQPLTGKRIVVTRAEAQAGGLVERLRMLGAEPVACAAITIAPLTDVAPLDSAIAHVLEYNWLIVTSANGVWALLDRMVALNYDIAVLKQLSIGAIGPATATALEQYGLHAS